MTDELLPIIERIQKLHAKAESAKAIGSLHEAEAFAEGVQRMLLKYKLDLSILDLDTLNIREPQGTTRMIFGEPKKRREPWLEALAGAVSRHHGVRMFVMSGTNGQIYAGRKSDREVALFLIGKLVTIALALADEHVRRVRQMGHANVADFRRSFLLGFANAIGTRLNTTKQEMGKTTAIVKILDQALEDAHKSFFEREKDMKPAAEKSRMDYRGQNREAYREGRRAGESADLSASGLRDGAPSRAALPGGR